MELLAQVQPLSASGLQIVIAGLVLLLGLAVGVTSLYNSFRRKPPIEAEFVAKLDCSHLREGIGLRIAKVETAIESSVCQQDFRDLRTEIAADVRRIHDKVESDFREILTKLDEMQASINSASERRSASLHERMNGLGERLSRVEGKV